MKLSKAHQMFLVNPKLYFRWDFCLKALCNYNQDMSGGRKGNHYLRSRKSKKPDHPGGK